VAAEYATGPITEIGSPIGRAVEIHTLRDERRLAHDENHVGLDEQRL